VSQKPDEVKDNYMADEEDLKTEPSEVVAHVDEPATF